MANNPTLLSRILAEDGEKNTIPSTTGATTGLFSEQYGWQSINSLPLQAGGKAVKREDFNGAFNLLGGVAFYAQKGWVFKFDNTQAYYTGCVVRDTTDNKQYECIADVSAGGSAPSTDATHWKLYSLGTDIDAWFRQPSTSYKYDDIRYLATLPPGWYLVCSIAGISSAGDLTISTPTVGSTVTDGGVTWTIEKMANGDGVPLGAILPLAHNSTLPAGYLLCDGSAVSRTMYPDLFAAIGTTYGAGDGSTTFNVPDYNAAERFVQGSSVAGTVKTAGLPNIEGTFTNLRGYNGGSTGAIQSQDITGSVEFGPNTVGYTIDFDASRSNPIYGASNTVQPNALTARYIIKAFDGQTADSALIDITQYASELANKADRSLSNLTQTGQDSFLERDFTIIYPNGGSESSPANVTDNTRYVESNPFPGYYVKCEVEVYFNNQWGWPGNYQFSGGNDGTAATQLDDDNIIIQVGFHPMYKNSVNSLNPFGSNLGEGVTSIPCRVKVWKIGKIPTA